MSGTLEEKSKMDVLEVSKSNDLPRLAHVDREMRFTETFRKHEHDSPLVREVECLGVQIPASLMAIVEGDWLAGRLDQAYVGIDPEHGDLIECAFYCWFDGLREQLDEPDTPSALREKIEFLLDFWDGRTTWHYARRAFSDRLSRGLPKDNYYDGTEISYPMFGLGGPVPDYGKLVRVGIGGLRQEVQQRRADAGHAPESLAFYDSVLATLGIFADAIGRYEAEAREKARQTDSPELAARYSLIAESCAHVVEKAPESYHQGLQLVWLYSLAALPKNYGRMDVYLGDLLAHDLDSGILSDDKALDITVGFFELIFARGNNFNNRMIIGGKGRPNAEHADRFALLALEAQGRLNHPIPQIALRWSEDMDPRIWDKALDVIAKGSTQPMLYNDDVNVPAAAKAFDVSMNEAEQYVMYGCGEYILDHRSVGSPDAGINLVKAMNATLFNGHDPFFNEPRGLSLGAFTAFATFEDFRDAVMRQIDNEIALLAEAQATIYHETGKHACYPLLSMLYDDCLERGKPLLAGGVRYLGGTCEAFGASTVSDSLLAIKKAVYEDRIVSGEKLLSALKANFEGHEELRRHLLAYPKFGNDEAETDAMNLWFNERICESCRKHGKRFDLDSFMIVLINNGDSISFGKTSAATPDGRQSGVPIANGNQPGAGYDQSGMTALLNSMGKLDPALHAGVVHNLKLSRTTITEHREKISALLKAYFAGGGTQLMITVTDRGELEAAMKEPEKYTNLIVRVGGYSERFIDLPRDIQLEILRRTLY